MKLMIKLKRLAPFFLCAAAWAASAKIEGVVTGTVMDPTTQQALELVAVTLKKADGAAVESTVTDARGRFTLENIPPGDYVVTYNLVGADARTTARFAVDAQHVQLDLGSLNIGDSVVKMDQVEVKAGRSAFLNSIDRKVYNVGKEIQSATGSASDLLQNLPSVQVDIDGNVSLRGSDNVMILLNGRTSTLMGKSRAEVLAQLPADSIDKIEVITNPSAKYKPDGTAGIINIVLKKKQDGGYSSTANAAVGNDERHNAGASGTWRSGPYTLSGSLALRWDDRQRTASDVRTIADPATGALITADKRTKEHARVFTWIARGGGEYALDKENKLGLTASFDDRGTQRHATDTNLVRDSRGAVTSDYDRIRYSPESERSLEWAATWQHTFPKEDHELNVEFKSSSTKESEPNHYTNIYRTGLAATSDNVILKNSDRSNETIFEYVYPLDEDSKFEAGYTRTAESLDNDFLNENLDSATGRFVRDATKSNRFKLDSTIHAFYATYGHAFGKFGFLAGLRPELAYVTSHLVNTGESIPNDYSRVYPSLHLAYKVTEKHEVQLNYSHRVHRPESDELNPFPEYIDPFNLRAGNPRLLPEDIHSVEAGYSFKQDETSFTSTVYHRALYHGFTSITRNLGGGVLLNTRENLVESRSTGLELTANTDFGKLLSVNFSSNTFFNTIDASNLGYSASKSDVSWIAKLGATVHLPKNTLWQFNTNYSSSRLTPQGHRRPSFVANTGLRHDFAAKKAAVVLTVSDVFNSLKESTVIDTPFLKEETVRRRSSRIVYLGLIYNFGKPAKKSKDDPLKFDNSL